ncbi:hypothetical protein P9112_002219 [Eukaryota sp. TZLM1-RC]
MVECRIKRSNLVQSAISEATVPAQFDESVTVPDTQVVSQTQSQNQFQVQPQGNQFPMEQAVDQIITVNSESPTPTISSDTIISSHHTRHTSSSTSTYTFHGELNLNNFRFFRHLRK